MKTLYKRTGSLLLLGAAVLSYSLLPSIAEAGSRVTAPPKVYDRNISRGEISLTKLAAEGVEPIPLVAFAWDDGRKADMESLFVLTESLEVEFGIDFPMGIAVEAGKLPETVGRVNVSDIQRYFAGGWEIMGHGYYSSNTVIGGSAWFDQDSLDAGGWRGDWSTSKFTIEDIEADLCSTKVTLERIIGDGNVRAWCYPNSGTSPAYANLVAKYYEYGFLNEFAYDAVAGSQWTVGKYMHNAKGAQIVPYGARDGYNRSSTNTRYSYTNGLDDIGLMVRLCIAANAGVVFTGHSPFTVGSTDGLPSGGMTTLRIKRAIRWMAQLAAEGEILILSPSDLLDRTTKFPIKDGASWFRNQDWSGSANAVWQYIDGESLYVEDDDDTIAWAAGSTGAGYIPNGFSHASTVALMRPSCYNSGGWPRVSRGTGWGASDELLMHENFVWDQALSFDRNLPADCWANFSFYVRVDTAIINVGTDITASQDHIELVIKEYSWADSVSYTGHPDTLYAKGLLARKWGGYPFPEAEMQMDLRSTSSLDDIASTGCRSVRIHYLDEEYSAFYETLNTDGTIKTNSTVATDIYRILAIEPLTYGGTGQTQGILYLQDTGNATTYAEILPETPNAVQRFGWMVADRDSVRGLSDAADGPGTRTILDKHSMGDDLTGHTFKHVDYWWRVGPNQRATTIELGWTNAGTKGEYDGAIRISYPQLTTWNIGRGRRY